MNNYREWHENGNIFFREIKLHFGQCDLNQRLSLPELLLITSDSAVEDFHQRGMSFDILLENGVVFLLSRLVFKIHSFPKAEDRFVLKTWEDKPSGGLLSRKYEMKKVVVSVDCPPCGKIREPENMEKLGEREAGYSDMDANGHMNNSRYAAFIMDFLPEELQKKEIDVFKINFAKEARKGDIISIYAGVPEAETENKITVVGKSGEHVCFESELTFK